MNKYVEFVHEVEDFVEEMENILFDVTHLYMDDPYADERREEAINEIRKALKYSLKEPLKLIQGFMTEED